MAKRKKRAGKSFIYVTKKTFDAVSRVSKVKGLNNSVVIDNLVEQAGLGREDAKPAILLIPTELFINNSEQLLLWLNSKVEGIHNYFYPKTNVNIETDH